MPWVRIDDDMPDSLKVAPLSDAAFRAYVTSICYAARNLTDGFVPMKKAKEFAVSRALKELVPMLWEPSDGGFYIHDYLDYNPTKAEVIEERRQRTEARVKAGRLGGIASGVARREAKPKQTRSKTEANGQANGQANTKQNEAPSRPLPSPTPITPPPAAPPVEQVLRQRPNIFKFYEQLLGKGVSPLIAERLKDYETTHSPECIEHCFQEAAESNARSVKLVYEILDRHKAEGCYAERPGKRSSNGVSASEPATPNYGVDYKPAGPVPLTDELRKQIEERFGSVLVHGGRAAEGADG